ncbi:hypothetical protein TNCV_742081 [Trichonephila clavipes]|nr:hypothetical protein TNCV_742081 [Trichonephila clavipes]
MSTIGLEYTFAMDLIKFVMKRQKIDYKYLKNIPSTLLTPTIRNFLLEYLKQEETNIYSVYIMRTKNLKVDCHMFNYVLKDLRRNVFSYVNTVTEVIRYCTLISLYALMAHQDGAQMAPDIALKEISEVMKTFISEKAETSCTFWASLDSEVSKLLPESFSSSASINSPIKQEKFLQEQTPDVDETLQEQREQPQSSPEQALESHLKDEEANIPDERENLNLTRLQTNNTSQNEEERLVVKTKEIEENQRQQKLSLKKYKYGDPKNQLEETDLLLECEKEKKQCQLGEEKFQISRDQQLQKIEVVKDLLQGRTPQVHNQPQIPDQLQQNQTLSEIAVQQDQTRVGKAAQQDHARVEKAEQQDQTRVGKEAQQDQTRVGKAVQQDQNRSEKSFSKGE